MGLFTDGFKLLKKASEPLYKTPKSIQETIEKMCIRDRNEGGCGIKECEPVRCDYQQEADYRRE